LTAAISSLQEIVDTLPQFLSPYLMQLLAVYCHFSALHKAGSATKKPEKPTKLHSELMKIK
jgi:branched-subunit amino acid transport protein AzlD